MMCTVPQIRKEQIDQQHSCKAFALAGKNLLFFSNSRTVKRILIFSFSDDNARKNFTWINFGVSVDG